MHRLCFTLFIRSFPLGLAFLLSSHPPHSLVGEIHVWHSLVRISLNFKIHICLDPHTYTNISVELILRKKSQPWCTYMAWCLWLGPDAATCWPDTHMVTLLDRDLTWNTNLRQSIWNCYERRIKQNKTRKQRTFREPFPETPNWNSHSLGPFWLLKWYHMFPCCELYIISTGSISSKHYKLFVCEYKNSLTDYSMLTLWNSLSFFRS